MLNCEVTLFTGMTFGKERLHNATIREETLGDELAVLDAGNVGTLVHRRIMIRRVIKIGTLDNPSEEIVAKLTRTDWELLENAMIKMDTERSIAAGLAKPEAEVNGGRDEPGGEAPGAT